MDDQTLPLSDVESSKPVPRRRPPAASSLTHMQAGKPPRPKVATPKASEVVEVTCAPRHLQPWGVLLAAVIVLAVVVFAVVSYTGKPTRAWNAVFLTNGQVYFGHIARDAQDTLVLRDVFYLQVAPPLQQRDPNEPATPPQASQAGGRASPDITLVKLGNELHGPTDAMSINREHVLFTEELRNDSTIVQAIAAAQARAAAPTQPTPPMPVAPPVPAAEAPVESEAPAN